MFFRPFGLSFSPLLPPTAYAVGCILPPLRGFPLRVRSDLRIKPSNGPDRDLHAAFFWLLYNPR